MYLSRSSNVSSATNGNANGEAGNSHILSPRGGPQLSIVSPTNTASK